MTQIEYTPTEHRHCQCCCPHVDCPHSGYLEQSMINPTGEHIVTLLWSPTSTVTDEPDCIHYAPKNGSNEIISRDDLITLIHVEGSTNERRAS